MFRRHTLRQQGAVLIYVTITLVIAMIVLPALLVFIGGASRTAQIREDRMQQVYAADAGIDKAFNDIIGNAITRANGTDGEHLGNFTILAFNDNVVDVNVYDAGKKEEYQILSTATNWEGVSTTIESYVRNVNYFSMMDNVLTSPGNIRIQGGKFKVEGTIQLGGLQKPGKWDTAQVPGPVVETTVPWPSAALIKEYYANLVEGAEVHPGGILLLEEDGADQGEGPGNMTGNPVISSEFTPATLTLDGTLYADGALTIGGSNDFDLHLNGHTIFSESTITVNSNVKIEGPGCIIALGTIHFTPRTGNEEFVFIMSLGGVVHMNPMGEFHGSIAGDTLVVQNKGIVMWEEWPDDDGNGIPDLFFPPGGRTLPTILTYTILD